ncbi:MAG TPA: PAS domain S-box protein [Polyangiaceae bacterium]|nr:PAS domain S-box protein [Polyangiaceae bacterium]
MATGVTDDALRLDDERYRKIIEQASDGIFISNASGVYLDVNESGARMLGMARNEIVGRRVTDVLDAPDQGRFAPELGRVLSGEVRVTEWRFRRKDGSTFPGEVSAKRLSDGNVQGILRDISERKRAEVTLLQSEERFRHLAAAAFDGLVVSFQGKVVDTNDQLAEMLGYPRLELIGKDVMEMVAPESREFVTGAMRSGHAQPYEHLALRKDGSTFYVEVRGKVIDLGGREARVTIIRDVSQRRRVEHAVRAIVEGTSAVGTEFFGALVRGVAHSLGVRHAFIGELLGDPPDRVHTLALWSDGQQGSKMEFLLQGTPYESTTARCCYPSGVQELFPRDALLANLHVQSCLGVPLASASGEPLGWLVALHDQPLEHSEFAQSILTIFAGRAAAELERLRSDAALRHSEESLRATIDTTPHVAIQWYDGRGRVLLWNRASEQMFGWKAQDAIGKTLDQLIHTPDETRAFLELIAEIGRTKQPFGPIESHFRRSDGSEGDCLSTMFSIPDAGGHPRFVCMDVDISERRRAEQQKAQLEAQLRHTQQLEALGTLAGGIAHDFNNVLAAIFAYGELAQLDADQPQQARSHLVELQKAADRARDLVQQILTFSRRQVQDRCPARLQNVVQEAIKFLRSTLPATIEIETYIDWQAPLVLAASIQLHQVILNLCTNAAHAMQGAAGGQGKLGVRVETLTCELASEVPGLTAGRYVRLTVSDTGHGMNAETRQRIFEPFFTTKAPGEGTGLGLAVVHGIVRDHEGVVRVESELGRGTKFQIYLPAHDWVEAGVDEGLSVHSPGKGERILFVDDETALCDGWRSVLERIGYLVTTFTNPLLALEAFRRSPRDFDLVITDLTMPHMTGTELGRRILELRPTLPILLVSGSTGSLTGEEVRALGLRDLLTKPVTPSALAVALRRTLDAPQPPLS